MPVETLHPDYLEQLPRWRRMRDAVAGQDAVHAAGTTYLPKLSGQKLEEYDAYRKRAQFYNATNRTVDGLTGMVFRQPPLITKPERNDAVDEFLDDVALEDIDLTAFAENCVEEVIVAGRAGIFVDFPQVAVVDETGDIQVPEITEQQARDMNLRPYFRLYKAEDIFNWSIGRHNNAVVLNRVHLFETYEQEVEGAAYTSFIVERIRVLELDEVGFYRQSVYEKLEVQDPMQRGHRGGGMVGAKKRFEWVLVEQLYPLMNGERLKFIPFVFLGPRDTRHCVCKPPLIDLADTNFSHYRTTADYEHAAHFTSCPTPVITGYEPQEGEVFQIGSSRAWVLQNDAAEAFYLEFEGQGLSALEKQLDRKEQQMASLGARMLEPDRNRNETAEAARLRRLGESSILASIAIAVGNGLSRALSIALRWMALPETDEILSIELNRQFMPMSITPQHLQFLFQMLQAGKISYQTIYDVMRKADLTDPDRTVEQEVELVRDERSRFSDLFNMLGESGDDDIDSSVDASAEPQAATFAGD